MKEPLISVIIPIYNTEQYLEKCLDSVVNQTYKNLEIICVNDGSTDGSLAIMEKYAENDNRIKIITQENSGQSAARNRGLDSASGDWISFIDSDDYFGLNLYETFINTLNNGREFNIYCFNGVILSENDDQNDKTLRKFFYMSNWIYHKDNIYNFLDCKNPFMGNMGVYNKIYKSEFLKKYNIKFKHSTFEDFLFWIVSFVLAESIYLDKNVFYYYLQRENSTMTTLKENCFDVFDIMNDIKNLLVKCNIFQYKKYAFLENLFNAYSYLLMKIDDDFKEQFFYKAKRKLNNEYVALEKKEIVNSMKKNILLFDFLSLEYNEFMNKYKSKFRDSYKKN